MTPLRHGSRGSALGLRTWVVSAAFLAASSLASAIEGISAHVTQIDQEKKCLSVEWNNDTEKKVCWNDKTKFSVLDTGKRAQASDLRVGHYLRMEGEDRGDTYWATEIEIWEEASKPAGD